MSFGVVKFDTVIVLANFRSDSFVPGVWLPKIFVLDWRVSWFVCAWVFCIRRIMFRIRSIVIMN